MSHTGFDFGFEPLGKGKLGIMMSNLEDDHLLRNSTTLPSRSPPPPPSNTEDNDDTSLKLLFPYNRDLSGFTLDSMSSVCCTPTLSCPNALERVWKEVGVPPHIAQLWLQHSTLGYFLTCIKNPNNCEPKSLIFWVGKNFKVGFDQRDGINIFFLAWRTHLTIDLDDVQEDEHSKDEHSDSIFRARLNLLSQLAKEKNLAFAIYRTDRGYHAIELTSGWDPTDPEVLSITRLVGGDIRYAAISALQGWRLRLTPKSKTPNDFVVRRVPDTFGECSRIHDQLQTLVVGSSTHIPASTIQMMNLYLDLVKDISNYVNVDYNLIVSNIMLNSNIAYAIRDVVDKTLNLYPTLKEDVICDEPFKSLSLMFESFFG